MVRMGEGRRPLAAYHEAGHCVVRLFFGHSFEHVIARSVAECRAGPLTDGRGRERGAEGLVVGYDICSPSMTPEIARRLGGTLARENAVAAEVALIEALAGIVAEARHRKVPRDRVILEGGREDWQGAKAIAARWFASDPKWALAVAEKRAAAVLQSPAGQIAVADIGARLLADGVLEGEAAAGIFAAAYGRPVPHPDAWTNRWPPTPATLREGL
jgi:hypothetical protein